MTNRSGGRSVIVQRDEGRCWEAIWEIPAYSLIGENGVLHVGTSSLGPESSRLYVVSGEKQWMEDGQAAKAWDTTYGQFFQIILGREMKNRFIADGHDALANMRIAREVIAQCQAGDR